MRNGIVISAAEERQVLGRIEGSGLDASEFVWAEHQSALTPGVTALRLIHVPSGGYFQFDRDGVKPREWRYISSGGGQQQPTYRHAVRFEGLLRRFVQWLGGLADAAAPCSADCDSPPRQSRGDGDRVEISRGLDDVKRHLVDSHDFSRVQFELIEASLAQLKMDARRLGPKDWLNAVVSAVLGLIGQLALPPETAHAVLDYLAATLPWLARNVGFLRGAVLPVADRAIPVDEETIMRKLVVRVVFDLPARRIPFSEARLVALVESFAVRHRLESNGTNGIYIDDDDCCTWQVFACVAATDAKTGEPTVAEITDVVLVPISELGRRWFPNVELCHSIFGQRWRRQDHTIGTDLELRFAERALQRLVRGVEDFLEDLSDGHKVQVDAQRLTYMLHQAKTALDRHHAQVGDQAGGSSELEVCLWNVHSVLDRLGDRLGLRSAA